MNKVIVITGASSGFGKGIAKKFAEVTCSIVNMPKGGVVPKMIVYGQAQEIIPF